MWNEALKKLQNPVFISTAKSSRLPARLVAPPPPPGSVVIPPQAPQYWQELPPSGFPFLPGKHQALPVSAFMSPAAIKAALMATMRNRLR